MNNNSNNIEETIIDTARAQFIKHGFECTSMSEIATLAGVSRPTLHYYFRTKEKMFEAVFTNIIRKIIPELQTAMNRDLPFIDKLAAIIDKYIDVFLQNPDLPYFIFNEIQRDPAHLLATAHEVHIDSVLKDLQRLAAEETAAGRLKAVDPAILFSTFYGMLVFPIISRNVLSAMFFDGNGAKFEQFMQDWKAHILNTIESIFFNPPAEEAMPAADDAGTEEK